ncbi:MAG: NUDIX hydrolase [Erysipelotrichia bacterium]|nr:NUDIX hydrolase [Erysipelotrichia bacterium]NCC55394.1 NUDIX hydrolase [Erysipelotrichia bacterium]
MQEKCIKKEVIYDGKIIRVEKDEIELEDGHRSMREVVFNSGGVCVLAFDQQGKVVLAKQFRYPSKEELYELPGGKQNANEDLVSAGMRELEEETGYTSEDATYFGYFYPTVAYCSEIIHIVLAKNCVYKKQHLDEGEHVSAKLYDYEEVKQMIFRNEIKDGKTIVAVLKYEALKSDGKL